MKRSSQVGLLLMGTVAVGSAAYLMMPSEHCTPSRPSFNANGTAALSSAECSSSHTSSSSGGSGGGRTGFFGGGGSDGGASSVSRGGFGSSGHGFSGT